MRGPMLHRDCGVASSAGTASAPRGALGGPQGQSACRQLLTTARAGTQRPQTLQINQHAVSGSGIANVRCIAQVPCPAHAPLA
jgi:hypothetical protein